MGRPALVSDLPCLLRDPKSEDWPATSHPSPPSPPFFPQITAVCNFFTYIRYIQQGLVRQDGERPLVADGGWRPGGWGWGRSEASARTP